MENLDLIIYTPMVILLFIGFIIGTFGEFRRMDNNAYTGDERDSDTKLLKRFLNKLFG